MIELTINGQARRLDAAPDMPLLWALRDILNLTGTKHGCGIAPCGYCQSGQIMAAAALLRETPRPTDAQIDAALEGHVCRCGSCQRIRAAMHQAGGHASWPCSTAASRPPTIAGTGGNGTLSGFLRIADDGRVVHAASNRALGFGELAEAAARLPEVFGAELDSFDAAPAMAIPGVVQVVPIPRGLAVAATNTWAALRGAEALVARWKATPHDGLDSAGVLARLRAALDQPQRPRNDGDWEATRAAAARAASATDEVPSLAHAPMQTENGTVRVTGDRAEVWAPTQHQDWCVRDVAAALSIPPAHVTMHTTYAGGGFGWRLHVEVVAQAAHAARALGRPVQLMWSRGDEFAQGHYRPAFAAKMEAALDASGRVTGFNIRAAGGSVMYDDRPWLFRNPSFMDPFALQSVTDTRYRLGAFRAEYARLDLPPKVWVWRSVGSSQYGFFVESFLDEVAAAANKDLLALRRELLPHRPHQRGAVDGNPHHPQRPAAGWRG